MAEVFLAIQSSAKGADREVVIKAILPHMVEDAHFVDMFMREARVAAMLEHPHIAEIYDVTVLDDRPCIVMEFLKGRDLWTVLNRLGDRDEVIKARPAAAIIAQAASGLDYAHMVRDRTGRPLDLVHRDVSPHNLFLTRDGNVKVLDFGIAKSAFQGQRTESGVIKGKLAYMAPEQARGKDVDFRADQFSLGVILWEMLTGKRLFARDDALQTVTAMFQDETPRPSEYRPVPADLEAIVMQTLSKSPTDRFDSCESLAIALRKTLDGRPASEPRLVQRLLSHAIPETEDAAFYASDRKPEDGDTPPREERTPSHSGVETRLPRLLEPGASEMLLAPSAPRRSSMIWIAAATSALVVLLLTGIIWVVIRREPELVQDLPPEEPSIALAAVVFTNVPEGVVLEIDGVELEGLELTTAIGDDVHHIRALHEGRELWRYDAIFRSSASVELPPLTLPESGDEPEVSDQAPAVSTRPTVRPTAMERVTERPQVTPMVTPMATPDMRGLGMDIDLGYP